MDQGADRNGAGVMGLSEQLRQAIQEDGRSLKQLARVSGVARSSISRFMAGKSSLNLDKVDKLARCVGLLPVQRLSSFVEEQAELVQAQTRLEGISRESFGIAMGWARNYSSWKGCRLAEGVVEAAKLLEQGQKLPKLQLIKEDQ